MRERQEPTAESGSDPVGDGTDRGIYETIFCEMEDAVFLIDVEETDGSYTFRFRRNNPSHQRLTDISLEEIRGKTPRELLGDEQGASVAENYRRCVETRETIEYGESLALPGGRREWQTRLSPVIEDGSVTRVVGVARDVTEQKERERTLQQIKNRLELAVEGAQLGIWDWDMTTDEVEFNEQWAEMLGHSLDEVEPHLDAWERRVHPDDLGPVKDALSEHIAGETPYYDTEHRMRTATGEWKWIRDVGKVVKRDEDGEPVRAVGIHLDIDDQKRREEDLERTRALIERTQESASIGWWEVDLVDESLTWSDEVHRIHGVPVDESVDLEEAIEFYHPDDRETIETAFDRLIEDGESYDLELRVVTASGRSRWVRAIGDPQFDDAGNVVGALGLFQDITERREYEIALESTREEFREIIDLVPDLVFVKNRDGEYLLANEATAEAYGKTQEYERTLEQQRDSLTLLNQVVRHDIRNQLMVVESYTELLEDSLPDDQSRTYARTVIEAAKQATEITETAKDVTDVLLQVGSDRTPMSLRDELSGQIETVRTDQDRATVSVDGDIPDVTVMADDLLEAVFRNLLTNAVVHNNEDVAEIAVSTRVLDDAVRVSIADNGPGIEDTHKEQIFQEGEKGLESGGTGVGLYLVKTLVDKYGGDVWVEDNEPTGSVFVVELPLAD